MKNDKINVLTSGVDWAYKEEMVFNQKHGNMYILGRCGLCFELVGATRI